MKDWYYLEIRKPGGPFENFLATDAVSNGVSIRAQRRCAQTDAVPAD